jgi:hypothetical protein
LKIHFNELNYETLYPLTVKLDNGNVYDGRFTDMRVDRASIPNGFYAYDVRDECDGDPCEIRSFILVNHMGTLITTVPIPEADKGEGYVVAYSYWPKEKANL